MGKLVAVLVWITVLPGLFCVGVALLYVFKARWWFMRAETGEPMTRLEAWAIPLALAWTIVVGLAGKMGWLS